MYTVYNDAKRGTLSAWSWPSREVASLLGRTVDLSQAWTPACPSNDKLQYINPEMHSTLLELIVETDKINVAQKLSRAHANSLRADGSVDRTQIDNVHVMAYVVTETGLEETLFLGFCEPKERGAIGYFKAIQDATSFTLKWENLFPLVSSVVTDGASINTGERRGL